MRIELTEQQRSVVQGQAGGFIEVIDPCTQRSFVLVAREQFDRVRAFLSPETSSAPPPELLIEIAPGIRKSQEALRRDLPQLLQHRRLQGHWVAYHGDERIGVAANETTLLRECIRRGLSDDAYYIGMIAPNELIEVEEIEDPKPEHYEGYDEAPNWADSTSTAPPTRG
jgi:hypothetical protein